MKYLQHFAFFVIISLFICNPAYSQPNKIVNPVKWSFSFTKTGTNEYDLVLKAKMDATWHIYSQFIGEGGPIATAFTFNKSADYQLIGKAAEKSKMIQEYDSNFEMMLKYFAHEAIFVQKVKTNGHVAQITGALEYMACNDKGCVGPFDVDYSFKLNEAPAKDTLTGKQNTEDTASTKVISAIPEKETPTSSSPSIGLWAFIIFALSQGLISLITPCVFPMIPMTVSFFTQKGKKKIKGIMNALIFGFSIIFLFMILGIVFGLIFGEDASHEISTHWIPNVFFFLIFFIFAASFLGMFEITIPSWMVTHVDKQSDKGGFFGPFFMAFTTVLVSFSCTGPLVANVVAMAKGGDILKSVVGMFAYGLAFATPFTLFAIFPKWLASLPKSGGWLNSVKVFLGFLELALGLKFLSVADQAYHWHLLDREIYLALWIVIFTLLGFYMLGKLQFKHDSDLSFIGVPRLFIAIVIFSFVIYLIPGMIGAPLKGLAGYLPPQHTHSFDMMALIRENGGGKNGPAQNETCDKPKYSEFLHLPHGIVGYFDYQQALDCAKAQNKPVFIDFTGHGCVNCREMEARVWPDPRILKMLKNDFVVVSLFVDDKTKLPENEWVTSKIDGKVKKYIGKKYADLEVAKYKYNQQPYYILIDANEVQLTEPRAYDLDKDAYVKWLETGLKKFKELHPAK